MRRISAAWRSLREESYFCAATRIFLCAESRRSMCRNDGIGEPRICPQSTASGDAWWLE